MKAIAEKIQCKVFAKKIPASFLNAKIVLYKAQIS